MTEISKAMEEIAEYRWGEKNNISDASLYTAIKALKKASMYHWHDLRRDKYDVPVNDGEVSEKVIFSDGHNSFFGRMYIDKNGQISWREIDNWPIIDVVAWHYVDAFNTEKGE